MSLYGIIAYEKGYGFNLVANSILGKELEIGSNNEFFWIWGKRYTPQALYYSEIGQFEKTKLRPVFNPSFVVKCLGIDELSQDYTLCQSSLVITEPKDKNTLITLIDPSFGRITDVRLYDYKNEIICSSKTISYYKTKDGTYIPNKMILISFEDGLILEMELTNPILNAKNTFILPNIKPQIHLP